MYSNVFHLVLKPFKERKKKICNNKKKTVKKNTYENTGSEWLIQKHSCATLIKQKWNVLKNTLLC